MPRRAMPRSTRIFRTSRAAAVAFACALTAAGCAGWPRAERPVDAGAPIVPAQPVPPAARTTLQAPSSVAPAQPTAQQPAAPASPPALPGAASAPAGPAPAPSGVASTASGPPPASAESPAAPRPTVESPTIVPPAPGLYRCEADRRAVIRRVSDDGQRIVLGWAGTDHTMVAVRAAAGAPLRWQDARAGLAWIVADGHALLLDLRQGRTLAADCRL